MQYKGIPAFLLNILNASTMPIPWEKQAIGERDWPIDGWRWPNYLPWNSMGESHRYSRSTSVWGNPIPIGTRVWCQMFLWNLNVLQSLLGRSQRSKSEEFADFKAVKSKFFGYKDKQWTVGVLRRLCFYFADDPTKVSNIHFHFVSEFEKVNKKAAL